MSPLPRSTPITRLLHEFRWKLAFTYSLFAVETLGLLLRPYFLGASVDGLLKGEHRDLVILVIVHLSYLIVGTVRHMYDTRTSRSPSGRDISRVTNSV